MLSIMQNDSDNTIEKGKGKTILPKDSPSTSASQPSILTSTSSTTPPKTPQPYPRPKPCPYKQMTKSLVTRWVPTKLLHAQGYLGEEASVQIPHEPLHQKSKLPSYPNPCQSRAKGFY